MESDPITLRHYFCTDSVDFSDLFVILLLDMGGNYCRLLILEIQQCLAPLSPLLLLGEKKTGNYLNHDMVKCWNLCSCHAWIANLLNPSLSCMGIF